MDGLELVWKFASDLVELSDGLDLTEILKGFF
jgi:hypothetical protein